ncbi:hypothetical protein DRO97_09985 [Archaeoglobales archaeon]|nr:MAG: hypothetical protein DRO97_09985 [Archaeoglobales archaeon]
MIRYVFVLIFLATSAIALSATPRYEEAGMVVFEDPSDISNSIYYILLIIGFTALILLISKWRNLLKNLLYFLVFISIYYVLLPFLSIYGIIVAALLTILLVVKPNWLIIDISALLLAAGIVSIFGISLEPLPVIVLLSILAIYDAISVYKTKHMLSLADSITDLKIPMLFIIPMKGFDFEKAKDKAAYMGVGDVVMPNILVVSSQYFSNSPTLFFIKYPALFSLIGSIVGMIALIYLVEKKSGGHAGLPLLNGGAIAGYLISQFVFLKF